MPKGEKDDYDSENSWISDEKRLPTKKMSFKKEVVHYSLLNNYCHARTITASKNPTQATPTLFGTKSVSLPETHIV